MKIGITGANGFVAWHLRCYLKSLGDEVSELRLADRGTFSAKDDLQNFVNGLDFIVHLAGVNRAVDDELLQGNLQPARQLIEALTVTGSAACILYSSTTHAIEPSTVYGHAKQGVSNILRDWAEAAGGRFINLIIPHVFGEYGKPFYNSGVATFCHQIVHGESPEVNPNGMLELVHVQDLVEQMLDLYQEGNSGDYRIEGQSISVPDVVKKLECFRDDYLQKRQFPDLRNGFTRKLFNTFRSYIDYPDRECATVHHTDDRGWLVETVKTGSGGQCFVSSTHPGIMRGNHFHRRKVERFFVLQGKAEIKLRKLFDNEVISYRLDGDKPGFVDIPTLHTHNITNIGDSELITLFWTDEFYDPEKPDTFLEEVE